MDSVAQQEQQAFYRMDVAEFNRRLDAVGSRLDALVVQVSILAERERLNSIKNDEQTIKIDELTTSANRWKGGLVVLAALGGIVTSLSNPILHLLGIR